MVDLHSDSARSYRLRVPGMLQDRVVYKKRRVKVSGKWVWKKPVYVRISRHTLPNGKKLKCKAGTQIIDRAWRFLKERVHSVKLSPQSPQLVAYIRNGQWEYWHRNKDLWVASGHAVAEACKAMVL